MLHYITLYYSLLFYIILCMYIYMLEHASWFLILCGLVYISKTYQTRYIHPKVVYYLLFFSCPGPDVGRCKMLFLLDVAFFLSNILVSIHKIGRWLYLRVDNRTCSCHYFELSNILGWGGVLTSFVVRTFNYVIDFSNILHGVGWGINLLCSKNFQLRYWLPTTLASNYVVIFSINFQLQHPL